VVEPVEDGYRTVPTCRIATYGKEFLWRNMTERDAAIEKYVKQILRFDWTTTSTGTRSIIRNRLHKALSILPEEMLDLFLTGERSLKIMVARDPGFPLGMKTSTQGAEPNRQYTVTIYEEHAHWSEDTFIGALLRELAHVVASRPPESEWPASRGDRARYKEMLECRADAMVWQWGLRHYSMAHLSATYPQHWVDKILQDISKMLLQGHPMH